MKKTILVLVANPRHMSPLCLDKEVREIDIGLRGASRRDEFTLKSVWAVRPVDVRRAMLDINPQVVHFCGHGTGEEGLAFEDNLGRPQLIHADILAEFFALFADKVECIVLNACFSELQANAIAQYIKFVVGMKKEIEDEAAIEFAVAFYDALGAGYDYKFAYKLACNAIRMAGIPGALLPVLKEKASIADNESRKWVKEFPENPGIVLEEEWEPFCQCAEEDGVEILTEFVDIPPRLPRLLMEAKKNLAHHVPDEHSYENVNAPFNGPCYHLRNVVTEVRRRGERAGCVLQFGPSDYRTFLITNGINAHWADLAGLGDEWTNLDEWIRRWVGVENYLGEKFFENCFGVNVLVTCLSNNTRYALFCERGAKVAVGKDVTVGSADEGLRRRFGDNLFDERSETDAAPDIVKTVYRAVKEEIGLSQELLKESPPIIVSAGRVRGWYQSGALVYWPLNLSMNEIRHSAQLAQDRHYEIGKMHFVPFNKNDIVDFVLQQESHAPVTSWTAAMAVYGLKVQGAITR